MGAPGVETEENDGGVARESVKRALAGSASASSADVAAVGAQAAAAQEAAEEVAGRFNEDGTLRDDAVPTSVASSADLTKRLIGGVRSTVDGSLRPTRGLYALEDPAHPGEIVDLVLGDVA
jgi:hypothetical protein